MRSFIGWFTALSPALMWLDLLALAILVRLGLGHWPKPMWENYRTLPTELLTMGVFGLGLFALCVAAPLWLLNLALPGPKPPPGHRRRQILCFAAGWVVVVATFSLDPFQFIAWLMD